MQRRSRVMVFLALAAVAATVFLVVPDTGLFARVPLLVLLATIAVLYQVTLGSPGPAAAGAPAAAAERDDHGSTTVIDLTEVIDLTVPAEPPGPPSDHPADDLPADDLPADDLTTDDLPADAGAAPAAPPVAPPRPTPTERGGAGHEPDDVAASAERDDLPEQQEDEEGAVGPPERGYFDLEPAEDAAGDRSTHAGPRWRSERRTRHAPAPSEGDAAPTERDRAPSEDDAAPEPAVVHPVPPVVHPVPPVAPRLPTSPRPTTAPRPPGAPGSPAPAAARSVEGVVEAPAGPAERRPPLSGVGAGDPWLLWARDLFD